MDMRLWYRWFWVKGFPFMAAVGLQRSSKPADVSGGGNTELDNGQPVRSQQHEHGCGKDSRATSRHRTVVALKRMGSNRDGGKNKKSSRYQHSNLVIATKRILARASIDHGFASFLDFEDLEGVITDHGRISDG
jgi:hypothetical protein